MAETTTGTSMIPSNMLDTDSNSCAVTTWTTGESTGNGYYTPVNNYYRYTLTETIIEASEIGGPMRIDTLSYHYMYSSPMTAKTDVTIWLQPTTKTAFSSSSDIDLLDTTVAVQVFSGAMNFSQGWNDIVLPTPYMFDGTTNLMVIVDDNSNAYNSSSYTFSTANCTGYKTIAWYSDSQNPDPTSTTYSGNKAYYQYRVRMALKGCDLATCRAPYNFAASDVTATGATLSWNDNNDGATYTIYNMADTSVVASGLTATTYALTGLTDNTTYTYGVEANCSATDASLRATVTFTTPCVAFSVPYTENFDSYTSGVEPNCWTLAHQDVSWSTASYGPQIYYSSTYAHSGSYSLRLYYRCLYALPAMDTNINLLQMNFWVRQTSSYSNLAVGVMSDLSDESTFVPVDTIVCSSTSASEEHTIYFNEYTGTGRHIAFRNISTYNYTYSYNYIDDVTVSYLPSCLPVSDVSVSGVENNVATLTWTDNSNTGATYTLYNLTDNTVVASGLTTNSYTITGLNGHTEYHFGVQANCSATDASSIQNVTVVTLPDPILCGDDEALVVANADNATTTTNYFPGYSFYNYSYTEVIIPANRLGDLNEIKGMEFKPNTVAAGSSYFNNCEIYLMNTTATSLANGFIQDSANFQLVYSGDLNYDNTNWQQVTFDNSFIWNGSANVVVAIRRNHGSYTSSGTFAAFSSTDTLARYVYQDGSAYEIGTITGGTATTTIPEYHLIGCPVVDACPAPYGVTVSNVTSYSANVRWVAPRSNYILYYAQQGSTVWDSMLVNAETQGVVDSLSGSRICSVQLNELTGVTNYEVRLRTVCDSIMSNDYVLNFMTGCPGYANIVLVGDTNVNITYLGSYLPTQSYYCYSATQQIYLASEIGQASTIDQLNFFYTSNTDTRYLKIYLGHTAQDAFSSSADVVPESQLTLVYRGPYTFSNSPRMNTIQLQVPFSYNGTDNLVLAVLDSTGSYQYSGEKFLTFSAPDRSLYRYTDNGYIDFASGSFNVGSYCNVLYMPGECDSTACPVPDFTIAAGVTSADVTWRASSAVEMQYRQMGASDYTTVVVGSSPVSITGLLPYTGYEVRMRNICGGGDSSQWVAQTFTTLPPNVSRLYVKSTAAGNATGTSWSNAINDLDRALQIADACYQQYGTLCDIWVAEGTYYGNTARTYAFSMVHGVRVYGGLAGNESEDYDLALRDPSQHPTILDGQGQRRVVYLNSYNYTTRTTLIDGVVIQNGYTSYESGGGIYGSYMTLSNSTVRNCLGYYGGGAYMYFGSIINCDIYGNTASNYAGGVYNYQSSIVGSTIHDNTSNNYVGGVYDYYGSLTNCLIYGNNASYSYGGLYAYSTTLDYCNIVNNTTNNYPCVYGSNGTWNNSIFWGNHNNSTTGENSNINYVTISHCAADFALTGDSVLLLAHANFGQGDSLYVVFANPEDNDYRLTHLSACVDRGFDTDTGQVDLIGRSRPYGEAPDMGCYEYSGEQFCTRPQQMAANHVSSFSALLTWESFLDTVVVEYALVSDSQWTALTVVDSKILLTNLASDAQYMVRAKALCDDEYSDYSDTVLFTTLCGSGTHGLTLGDTSNYSTSSGNYLPFNSFYEYSYTQTLITAEELDYKPILIDTLRFQYIHSSSVTRTLDIYLGHTDRAQFSSSADAVPASSLQLVYSGSLTFNNDNTWFAIPLQQPFLYNGANNLVIAVDDNTGSYISSGYRFATHSTEGNKSLYIYNDGTNYSLNGSYSFSLTSNRLNLHFPSNCQDVSCPAPSLVNIETAANSATFWTVAMGPLQMQYRQADADHYTDITPSDTVVLSGLIQNTNYELRARSICSVGDTSDWTTVHFTTSVQNVQRLYVKTTPAGLADGSSWENATADLNWAVATASSIHQTFGTRTEVWVAEGIYYGNTTDQSAFTMMPGVDVYGGFQGNEPDTFYTSQRNIAAHPTILSGMGERRVLGQNNNFDVADSACWDGFTLTAGHITGDGGGAYIRQNGKLSNCTITNCRASSHGGGVYAYNATLLNCVIQGDSAYYGGGIYGQYTTTIGCLVSNNTANYNGGIYLNYGDLNNCHIVANQTASSSYINYCSGSTVRNSVFWGNRNLSTSAVQTQYGYYHNCAFESDFSGSGTNNNCILLSSNNSGSINSPLFVRPSDGAGIAYANDCDWTLQEGSILIDHGAYDSTWVLPSTDLSGNARVQNGTIDIGCYESPYTGITLPEYTDGIIYVTPTGAGLRDGTSWDNAMDDINDAVVISSLGNHPDVWVAQGTYYGNTATNSAFTFRENVNLYGGFAGNEPANYDLSQRDFDQHPTILDAQHTGRVLYQSNTFSSLTVCDGFVLQNGLVTNDDGAGAYLLHGGRLRNCIVQNNMAISTNNNYIYGIGVRASGNDDNDTLLDRCIIRNNTHQGQNSYYDYAYHGGVYAYYATIINCQIYGNSSYYGGGVYADYSKFYNTVISQNQANVGAGVYCTSSNNFYNCIIAQNTATNSYGGIYCNSSNSNNFYNSIIWGNKVNYLSDNVSGSPVLYNSAVEGGMDSGINVLDLAATNDGNSGTDNYVRFIDPAQHDYHLHPASHCVDFGDSSYAHLPYDLDGNARINGNNIDLGAYESSASVTCPSPLNLRALAIASTSATIAWSPQGTESQWLFTIVASDGTLDSNIALTDTAVTISGLTLNRMYTSYVRANCGNEYSIRSPQLTFTTLCDTTVLTPLSEFTSLLPADSSIVYNSSVSFSWSALPEATSYDLYVWKGDIMPTTPSVAGITTNSLNNYTIPNYQRGAYYHWKVVAWNECINRTSAVQTFRTNPFPNLHVTSITHSTPMANQPMTVTWTVSNDGEGSTGSGITWNDYIWITSVDGIGGGFWYGVDEVLLAQVPNLTSLEPGQTYTNSITVNLPEDYIGGYYIFVLSDQYSARDLNYSQYGMSNAPDPYTPSLSGTPYPYLTGTDFRSYYCSVAESVENDNFFFKTMTILPPPSPDLRVIHVSHPINAFSNSDITVSWTVANQGSASASGNWYDDVYIQMGSELDMTQAQRLVRLQHNGGLAVDSSYQASATVHIPITYSGNYNIIVVTDFFDDVYESIFESNNSTTSQQQIAIVMSPLADLQVSNVTLPDAISPRCTYPVSWTVANNGMAATEQGSWNDRLYLSPTATYNDATAIYLKDFWHYGTLAVDSQYVVNTTITIPNNVTGTYYLIVKTDTEDRIFEYLNEDNNTGISSTTAQVLFPDLVVSSATYDTTVLVGAQQHVYAYIKNVGQGTAYGYFMTRFDNGSTIVTKDGQCDLHPGDSMLVSCLIRQGCVTTTNGELTIVANFSNQIPEGTQGNNNTRTFTYFISRADLVAHSLTFADTGWSGTQLPVTMVLGNQGTVPLSDSVSVAVYISNSPSSYTANDANRILLVGQPLQLLPDSNITIATNALLPNGISGDYYLHLVVDPTNSICESNETNNTLHSASAVHVNLSPYPDFVVQNFTMPDTLSIGQTVQFAYDIVNQGIGSAQGSMTVKVYMSLGSTFGSSTLYEVASQQQTLDLAPNGTLAALTTGIVPTSMPTGFYYFYVVVDQANDFYEHNGENNNTIRSAIKYVKIYPLDLTVEALSGPDSVHWGQRVTYVATVRNNSNVVTSAPAWVDRLYLTTDGTIEANSSYQYADHSGLLAAGESYPVSFNVTVPYGIADSFFLTAICDFNRNNPDVNLLNNQFAKQVFVSSVPTPDLQVSDLTVIGDIVSGQPFQLAYTVTNVAETPVAQQQWADKVFLSTTAGIVSTSLQLCVHPVERALASGASYRDTVEVTVPVPNQGSFYLVVQANAQSNFYEVEQTNNVAAQQISVTLPPPGDLMVTRIVLPDSVVSGRRASFQWTVTNIGANDITGNGLSSLLYLSADDAFSPDDRLLGRVNASNINLAPTDTLLQQLTARISGVTEGLYYIIAKTDVRNAFYEDNEANNSTVSTLPFYVKVRELLFDTPLLDTLYNGEPNDYKLVVGTNRNETVRIHVESDDSLHGAVNSIYVSHNTVGSDLSYQLSTIGLYTANPELYIPSTASGFYGVSLYGSVPADPMQVVTVTANILPFELRDISPNYGGNDGYVTIELTGSRFRPDMKVWMLHQGDTLFADTLIYSSYYQAFARFNLQGADTGYYSMGVLNYCEGEAMLTDVFRVTGPSPDGLAYHIVFPNSPRPNRTITMMLEFGNIGNTDIEGAVLEVQSVGGTYIALTNEGLSQQQTSLTIPLTIDGQPQGLLRPGSYGTVTIYGYTAGSLVFSIKQVQ